MTASCSSGFSSARAFSTARIAITSPTNSPHQRSGGADKFCSVFLKSLFLKGSRSRRPARSPDTRALLGKIRYLNGGLFLPHASNSTTAFQTSSASKSPISR